MRTSSATLKSAASARGAIQVRVPAQDQWPWFDGLLGQQHYLGAGRPVGDYLRQVVERDGQPVALLVWGPACYALKDRDRWISWSANQRLERLQFLVQNRRFLLLADKGREPNLASQALGAALRALPAQWQERFGYRPLLAESFTDPEACRAGLGAAPSGTLPVPTEDLDSLLDVLRHAPDPRDDNTRYRIGPVLTLIALALLAGRREIAEIARFATTLTPPQRRRLGLPRKKGTRCFYQVPGYGVFYQVLTRMDPEAFATLLTGWLQARAGRLPAALALDGKMIRDHIGLLTLAQHEDGAPQAVAVYDQKERRPQHRVALLPLQRRGGRPHAPAVAGLNPRPLGWSGSAQPLAARRRAGRRRLALPQRAPAGQRGAVAQRAAGRAGGGAGGTIAAPIARAPALPSRPRPGPPSTYLLKNADV